MSGYAELKSTVDLLHREGGVARAERDMMGGLLDLQELTVSDVMVHRTRMEAIDADLPPHELVRAVLSSPYTRLPLWRDKPENIIGLLHVKDLLRALDAAGGDAGKLNVDAIATDAWFVPDSTTLRTQLQAFRRRKSHFALVVDEYGEVMGLVTLGTDPRSHPRDGLVAAGRRGDDSRRPRHPRGARDPGAGPDVHLPRLPV